MVTELSEGTAKDFFLKVLRLNSFPPLEWVKLSHPRLLKGIEAAR